MDNEWLTYGTLRQTASNDSLFWLPGEDDRKKVLAGFYLSWQGGVTAKIKSRIYGLLWSDKKKKSGTNSWLCDVLSVIMFERTNVLLGSCLGSDAGISQKEKHACLFRQKQGVPVKLTWHHWAYNPV